jgi:hypothetical protein
MTNMQQQLLSDALHHYAKQARTTEDEKLWCKKFADYYLHRGRFSAAHPPLITNSQRAMLYLAFTVYAKHLSQCIEYKNVIVILESEAEELQ